MKHISTEYLYDILSDHFAFECEEDSWEKGQDVGEWERDQMLNYYLEFLGNGEDCS